MHGQADIVRKVGNPDSSSRVECTFEGTIFLTNDYVMFSTGYTNWLRSKLEVCAPVANKGPDEILGFPRASPREGKWVHCIKVDCWHQE